jgi:hypothetical protein
MFNMPHACYYSGIIFAAKSTKNTVLNNQAWASTNFALATTVSIASLAYSTISDFLCPSCDPLLCETSVPCDLVQNALSVHIGILVFAIEKVTGA